MHSAIISIVYNQSELIMRQTKMYRKFCKEPVDFIIIDNSNIPEVTQSIKYHNADCIYHKTSTPHGQPSLSHAFAANFAYSLYKDSYDYLLWTDHDLFPIKPFSIEEMLGEKWIVGLEQIRKHIKYLWGGFIIINNKEIPREYIDFYPANVDNVQLDTGGEFYRIIKEYPDMIGYVDEEHIENHLCKDHFYNFYAMLDKRFMHFINGSNWAGIKNFEQRQNSLLNILDEYSTADNSNG